jgi:hypothetical protein
MMKSYLFLPKRTIRDGNRDPILDSPREIPPLEDGGWGWEKTPPPPPPRGDINGENYPPTGKRGWRRGSIHHPRSPRGPVKLARDYVFVY